MTDSPTPAPAPPHRRSAVAAYLRAHPTHQAPAPPPVTPEPPSEDPVPPGAPHPLPPPPPSAPAAAALDALFDAAAAPSALDPLAVLPPPEQPLTSPEALNARLRQIDAHEQQIAAALDQMNRPTLFGRARLDTTGVMAWWRSFLGGLSWRWSERVVRDAQRAEAVRRAKAPPSSAPSHRPPPPIDPSA